MPGGEKICSVSGGVESDANGRVASVPRAGALRGNGFRFPWLTQGV